MKSPDFKFDPGDWIQDTAPLSLAARGAWIDILCALHRSSTRGTMTLPLIGWARLLRSTVDQAKAVMEELIGLRICDSNAPCNAINDGDVTLVNRRMVREENDRLLGRERQKRYRGAHGQAASNGDVTDRVTENKRQRNGDVTTHIPLPLFSPLSLSPNTPLSVSPSLIPSPDSCAATVGDGATPKPSESPTVMRFPVKGTGPKEWPLRQDKVDQYVRSFPAVDVLAECKVALQWCLDNPKRQKTFSGMAAFLGGWMGRAQNRAARCGGDRASPFQPEDPEVQARRVIEKMRGARCAS
jgi:hypothetical protein